MHCVLNSTVKMLVHYFTSRDIRGDIRVMFSCQIIFFNINKSDIEGEFKHIISDTSLTVSNLPTLSKIVCITSNLNYQSDNITCKTV